MNKKGIFVPTLVILSLLLFIYLNIQLNPMFSKDYNFKFIDVLNSEFELKKELFNNEQEIKYKQYEALDILFKNGICEDWRICNPTEKYEEEYNEIFEDIFKGDYQVDLNFNNGVKLKASKDVEFSKGDLKIKTRHNFENNIHFDWNIVKEVYENCKDIKNCDELGKCNIECSEDETFLNFETPIDLEFVKTFKFKVSKLGGLF